MLAALIVALLLGGSSGASALLADFEHARASIETAVEDRARKTELVALVRDAEKSMKAALKDRGKTAEQLVQLVRPYQAKAADAQPLVQKLHAEVEVAQEQVIRARFELKERMTREEWRKVFAR